MNIAYFHSFNNSFNCVVKNIHSKNLFIQKNLRIIHSTNLFIQKNRKLFIQWKYSFNWKMGYRPPLVGVGDRFRLFIQTLNNAWKPFNSIFNSKWNQKYSFNEFIHSNWTKLFKMWQIYPKNAQILLIHISGLSFQVKWNILKTWEVLDEFC